jgi:hypothetical protein
MITGKKHSESTKYLLISEIIKVDYSCNPVRIVVYDRSVMGHSVDRFVVHTECMNGITNDAVHLHRFNGAYLSDLDSAIAEFWSRITRLRKNRDDFADHQYHRISSDLDHNYS